MAVHLKKFIAIGLVIEFIMAISFQLYAIQEAIKIQNYITEKKAVYRKQEGKIPVLMYHHLSKDPADWGHSCISPDKLKEELLYLKLLGYQTILFKDYLECMKNNKPLPDNPIIITFDDGYLSNYKYAYPMLKEYNMKASIFIVGGSVGRKYEMDSFTPITDHFTWEQAKEMQDSNLVEIQHHTFNLHKVAKRGECGTGVERLRNESIADYQNRFEGDLNRLTSSIRRKLQCEVYAFAYPYGIYNEYTEQVLRAKGIKFSLTTEQGITDFSESTYLIKRINMNNRMESTDLFKRLSEEPLREIHLPFQEVKNRQKKIELLEKAVRYRVIFQNIYEYFNKGSYYAK